MRKTLFIYIEGLPGEREIAERQLHRLAPMAVLNKCQRPDLGAHITEYQILTTEDDVIEMIQNLESHGVWTTSWDKRNPEGSVSYTLHVKKENDVRLLELAVMDRGTFEKEKKDGIFCCKVITADEMVHHLITFMRDYGLWQILD